MAPQQQNRKRNETGLFAPTRTLLPSPHWPHSLTLVFSGAGAVCCWLLRPHRCCRKTPPVPPISTQPQPLWSKGRQGQFPHCALWLLPGFTTVADQVQDGCHHDTCKRKTQQTSLTYLKKESSYTLKGCAAFCKRSWTVSMNILCYRHSNIQCQNMHVNSTINCQI